MRTGFHALILAAGKGTRFKSDTVKVLHSLMGKSMLSIVRDSLAQLKPTKIHIVIGYQKEKVIEALAAENTDFVEQKAQLGTAHAVMAAKKILQNDLDGNLLVMNGDLPLIRPETLRPLVRQHLRGKNDMTFMTAVMEDPTGFGRVVFLEDRIRIIEEKDATPTQRQLKEGNVGIYMFKIRELLKALPKISTENKKGEYYLTDIIEILSASGRKVEACPTPHVDEIVGVNDRYEMARAIEVLRLRKIRSLTDRGVTFYDPSSTWIDFDVRIGRDTIVYPTVIIEGRSVIGKQCVLYPGVHILNSRIGDSTKLLTSTMIEDSRIASNCQLGPFSRFRPGCVIRSGAKTGNFVEMKNTVFGSGSKAMHLSYVGDTTVGEKTNIGAGTITCNYDGLKKSRTVIEDGAFIGSGTQLIAPVKVGKGAYVGAGSTITKDVSPDALAVSRVRQEEKKGWARRRKRKK
jgi:bifunctional UDP-N-acetylglucosamine pyrophosphorylase/glucosamine-1-phosphate N-acetyltransferase